MDNDKIQSLQISNERRDQRDSARVERDSALQERDDARTERDEFKQQNVSLETQNEDLENDKIAQNKFVATVSHDLRNPIGVIKMAVDVLRDGADPAIYLQMIELIERNADQAGDLISHLLDAHLIRSGMEFPLEKEECDIMEVLRKCHNSLAPEERERVELDFLPNEQSLGFWDPVALERVFKNLISNAIKFSDAGKKVTIRVDRGIEFTNVYVHNSGEVISPQNQLRIFDSQVRINRDAREKKKGWGLGLTLVKGIVEAHVGKVDVSSNKIEGTVFTVRLPTDLRAL